MSTSAWTDLLSRRSFIELSARARARALLDERSFRELVGPFERVKSPWLPLQGVVAQSDDGVVIARGRLGGVDAVVAAIEGAFQGGSIGEVSGSKIAAALELALHSCERSRPIVPVLILETGGVRLQEANLGLAAIAEIHAALVALRRHVPVIGVISGLVGCFGGMSLAAALCSTLIVTRQARLGMNGPEVIEQEAGVAELDASDRRLVWSLMGGEQRHAMGFADALLEDDVAAIAAAVHAAARAAPPAPRTLAVEHFISRLAAEAPAAPPASREPAWRGETPTAASRGRTWFGALAMCAGALEGGLRSVLRADAPLGGESARFLAVVPDPSNRFARARHGELGLEEAWTLVREIRAALHADAGRVPRPIVAIVDVSSQAYGREEERLGIHLACAAAVDAYASARLAGHPVIALLVGKAMSGAFLAHGYQANRMLALDAPGVLVHAMGKQAAARVTHRSVEDLERLGERIAPMAYDVRSFASLGLLHELIEGVDAGEPRPGDVERVRAALIRAVADARTGGTDLSGRLSNAAAGRTRAASIEVHRRVAEQWSEPGP